MLMLKRKAGESIMIADDVEVMVMEVDRYFGTVTLGVKAPKKIPVHRKEVWRTIKEAKENATR